MGHTSIGKPCEKNNVFLLIITLIYIDIGKPPFLKENQSPEQSGDPARQLGAAFKMRKIAKS